LTDFRKLSHISVTVRLLF